MIVGLGVAAVVVIALVVATVLVTVGGDEEPTAGNDPTSSADSEGPATDTSSPEPATGDQITGDGYSYNLPRSGWQDATAEAKASGSGGAIDSIAVLGSSLAMAQSNILVEALPAGGADSPEQIEPLWKRNLAGNDGAQPQDIEDVEIDGERAVGVEINDRENVRGVLVDQIVYLTVHEDMQYSLALTYPAQGDSVSEPDFRKALASWTWRS